MRPILKQIGHKESQRQLQPKRQILNPLLQLRQVHFSKKQNRWFLRNDPKKLNEQMADGKINQIGAPFFMESVLGGSFWKNHFDRNENNCHQQ